eukprot:12352424-Alexandrium_andersonii.AAC.1
MIKSYRVDQQAPLNSDHFPVVVEAAVCLSADRALVDKPLTLSVATEEQIQQYTDTLEHSIRKGADLVGAIRETSSEVFGQLRRPQKRPWISADTLGLLDNRNAYIQE